MLADAGYGSSGPFRQALSDRGLLWAVGLTRKQTVYPADIALVFPVAKTGKPRKYPLPDQPSISAEVILAGEKWQKVNWRRGTKGRLTCLFAARRVRVADGRKVSMLDRRTQCLPDDEAGLSANGDRPANRNTTCRTCRPMSRSRNSRLPLKQDGFVSRRTSNLRKS